MMTSFFNGPFSYFESAQNIQSHVNSFQKLSEVLFKTEAFYKKISS